MIIQANLSLWQKEKRNIFHVDIKDLCNNAKRSECFLLNLLCNHVCHIKRRQISFKFFSKSSYWANSALTVYSNTLLQSGLNILRHIKKTNNLPISLNSYVGWLRRTFCAYSCKIQTAVLPSGFNKNSERNNNIPVVLV